MDHQILRDRQRQLERVKELLAYDAHSRRYQAIPEFVAERLGMAAGGYASEQIDWDEPRYRWIDANLPRDVHRIIELGSSLGHFSLRFSHDRNAEVIGYEPVKAYAEVCNLFASLTGLGERASFIGKSVTLSEIDDLPTADAVISLNVLHHAGNVFDREEVAAHGSWTAYAVECLRRLSGKFRHLVFQTGNSAKGFAHFPSKDAVPVTTALLQGSGWIVKKIGVITDFEAVTYRSFDPIDMGSVPRIRCHRNAESGMVEYRDEDGNLLAELPYGTLQRPLFYCARA